MLWLNIWRDPNRRPPYEVTIHWSQNEAIAAVADDIEEGGRAYACTVLIEPETLDAPQRVDLHRLACDEIEDRALDKMAQEIESQMLRWRQAGM